MNQVLSNIISSISTSLVKSILFIGLVLILFFYIKSCVSSKDTDKYNAALSTWNIEKVNLLKKNDSLRNIITVHTKQVDSSNKVILVKTNTINSLQKKIINLKKKNDSTLNVLKSDTSCINKCQEAVKLAENYKSQSDSIQKVLTIQMSIDSAYKYSNILLQADKTFLVAQNDSLRKLIVTVPVYKPHKILGIFPEPDRKTSFIMGVVAGTVATIELSRHIK